MVFCSKVFVLNLGKMSDLLNKHDQKKSLKINAATSEETTNELKFKFKFFTSDRMID